MLGSLGPVTCVPGDQHSQQRGNLQGNKSGGLRVEARARVSGTKPGGNAQYPHVSYLFKHTAAVDNYCDRQAPTRGSISPTVFTKRSVHALVYR